MSDSTSIRRWADEQQYVAAPMEANRDDDGNITPTVRLLSMTADPLGAIAAMCRMYEGKVTTDLSQISDDERRHYFAQAQATHLRAPLEAVKFHFFLDGVTRSFTHQLVRQRTAVYSQESLRFAVKENMAKECSMPPSIAGMTGQAGRDIRDRFHAFNQSVEDFYLWMVNNGVPAEDARGAVPHWITTRANYITDLRNLSDHAGNRLCTQAQFEWRVVFLGIVDAIRNYSPPVEPWTTGNRISQLEMQETFEETTRWQFELLASSGLFRPVCYQLGKCPFKASFDRACSIRGRVDAFAAHGVPSKEWDREKRGTERVPNPGGPMHMQSIEEPYLIPAINPAEWLLDPAAARTGGGGHE